MDIHITLVLKVLDDLGNGINPSTGGSLPEGSVANEPGTIRALLNLSNELQPRKYSGREKRSLEKVKQDNRENGRPARSHIEWSDEENQKLIDSYRGGSSIEQLAVRHERTPLAIASRLHRQGMIEKAAMDRYQPTHATLGARS